jgi:hypothetical protein
MILIKAEHSMNKSFILLIGKSIALMLSALLAGASYAAVPSAQYYAAAVNGGPGIAGCNGAENCTRMPWGIALNSDTGFTWHVNGGDTGGTAYLYLRIAVPKSGKRAMSLTVNDATMVTVKTNFARSPRPTGTEFGPLAVNLNAGDNVVKLLDTEGTAEFDVHYLRVQDASVNSSVVEAEKYDKASPIAPFIIQPTSDGFEYITATDGRAAAPTAKNNTGQAHYRLTATAQTLSVYATVNLPDANSDSFFYQVDGLSAWTKQNGHSTMGFQEIPLLTVKNAVVGQSYLFKIQRREAGAQFDRFRLEGGVFASGTDPAQEGNPNESTPPTLISDIDFPDRGLAKCVHQAGKTLISELTELTCTYSHGDNLNLKGMEQLTALTRIELAFFSQDTLDLSVYPELTSLTIVECNLRTLDLSANPNLTSLSIEGCPINRFELSESNVLTSLTLKRTPITELDTSPYSVLSTAVINNNAMLSAIDMSKNQVLESVELFGNNLTTIQLPDPQILRSLAFDSTETLTIEDLARYPDLTALSLLDWASLNLDLSANNKLKSLTIGAAWGTTNYLNALNLSANTELENLSISAWGLPMLDLKENKALTSLTLYTPDTAPADLSANVGLTNLVIGDGNWSALDLSANQLLASLHIYCSCGISSLDLASNSNLTSLLITGSSISDITLPASLIDLSLDSMPLLASVNLSGSPALEKLSISNNLLSSLDLSANTQLKYLQELNNNQLELDLSANNALEVINTTSALTSRDLSGKTSLNNLNSKGNRLETNSLADLVSLETLYLDGLRVPLDFSTNTALKEINIGFSSHVTTLDFSHNKALKFLHIGIDSGLRSIDLSTNTALEGLVIPGGQLTELDLTANTALQYVDLVNNKLTTINFAASQENPEYPFDLRGNPLLCATIDRIKLQRPNDPFYYDEPCSP